MAMRMRRDLKMACLTGSMLGLLVPPSAFAALGAPESSVSDDVQELKASLKSTEHTNYRVHEIQLPSGTRVREFATPAGRVFAVAWSGPRLPNLQQTLGNYFDAYVTAAKSPHAGHTHVEVRQPDLVIQSAGHMRAFSGRAYLPQAIPTGVSVDELQ